MTDRVTEAQQRLNAAKDRRRRAAMGAPLDLTDDHIAALATVSDADVPSAEALWKMANPGPLGDLLDAQAAED